MNPINLSYSSLELLHKCPRKFELDKMLFAGGENISASPDLVAGHAFGSGLQEWYKTKSVDAAVWAAYQQWFPHLAVDFDHAKKTFWRVVKHLEKWPATHEEKMGDWDLFWFEDADGNPFPACELGFKVILSDSYTYRGFIDLVLYNAKTDEFAVGEIKTDGMNPTSVVKYANSFQGSSYNAVLQKIIGRPIRDVKYMIAEFPGGGQQVFDLVKSPSQKLNWLTSLGFDTQMLESFRLHKHFPMRGASCMDFFRPCKYFGLCELSSASIGKMALDGEYLPQPIEADKYHFTFTLEELLESHS